MVHGKRAALKKELESGGVSQRDEKKGISSLCIECVRLENKQLRF